MNDFDYKVIDYWKENTGVQLIIDETKLHPKNWKPKPQGWGLKKYNQERKRILKNKNI